ncbi:hypothetical protein HPB52_001390 [Rhipicephalus sanguineus]|uniref:Uncharacterized protein n=1 Tax=Rhipicephalus sanguineus TaxID=34632 RepID=A0A9D4T6S0_RHISA|nr:hypothetical protein HPB52_001390 [Rhipicephalus sanguineus]
MESNPPWPLPKCQHTSCADCLASAGGEGGWHKCRWSSAFSHDDTFEGFVNDDCDDIVCEQADTDEAIVAAVQDRGDEVSDDDTDEEDRTPELSSRDALDYVTNVSHWLQTLGTEVYGYFFVRPSENECTIAHHTWDAEGGVCRHTRWL